MTAQRDMELQFALIKEILDPKAQKRKMEDKIKAVDERNDLLLENAARIKYTPTCNQDLRKKI